MRQRESDAIEQRAIVNQILQRLSEDQRQLLQLYYFGERTLPEIATLLEVNLNTIKHRFYRAHVLAACHPEVLHQESVPLPG